MTRGLGWKGRFAWGRDWEDLDRAGGKIYGSLCSFARWVGGVVVAVCGRCAQCGGSRRGNNRPSILSGWIPRLRHPRDGRLPRRFFALRQDSGCERLLAVSPLAIRSHLLCLGRVMRMASPCYRGRSKVRESRSTIIHVGPRSRTGGHGELNLASRIIQVGVLPEHDMPIHRTNQQRIGLPSQPCLGDESIVAFSSSLRGQAQSVVSIACARVLV